MTLKPIEDVIACVVDYGSFLCVAEKLGETMQKVYYHSPYAQEFHDLRDCIKGSGLDQVERLDDFLDPDVFDAIDLFVFPDIGFGGVQRHLRSIGKAVWGHMGGNDLELYRTFFLNVLKGLGLPMVHSETIIGLSQLETHLRKTKNKWIKIDRFRRNMETWHHLDYNHSVRTLDSLAVALGGAKETVTFIVQDEIESEQEVGYDGWCIDGEFPAYSYQGYEKKNELYLGSLLSNDDLPEEIKLVNDAMAPLLRSYGYRTWWATEIRIAKGVPYFIDPTPRMPGQTGEHQTETCANFADVIWHGANGILIEPEFLWKFAAEATLHYETSSKDFAAKEEWKTLYLPDEVTRWVKLYHYCKIDGAYHFPTNSAQNSTDEVGVVLGVGDSIEEATRHLIGNLDALSHLPLHANVAGFASLLESINEAEEKGIHFADDIPSPDSIFDGKAPSC